MKTDGHSIAVKTDGHSIAVKTDGHSIAVKTDTPRDHSAFHAGLQLSAELVSLIIIH